MNVEKHKKRMLSPKMRDRLRDLPPIEQDYFKKMWPKSGVLFIQDRPGSGKTAILKAMTENMDHQYIDFRLTQVDETDFRYPYLEDVDMGDKTYKVSNYAVPRWAIKANERQTVIVFEELNRAPLFVRNAAMQILLERRIGDFEFNDNVLMVATGNLGTEDDTDVEDLDAAMKGRLIHVRHELTSDDWLKNFATEDIHPVICGFIKIYSHMLYQDSNGGVSYASPRTWTFLSDHIVCNYGPESSISDFMPFLQRDAVSYIGETAAVKFIKYCADRLRITVNDILNDWGRTKRELEKFNRDKRSELLQELVNIDLETLNDAQLSNIVNFLRTVSEDELAGYIMGLISDKKNKTIARGNIVKVVSEFEYLIDRVYQTAEANQKFDE